jgi:hypothetical protein
MKEDEIEIGKLPHKDKLLQETGASLNDEEAYLKGGELVWGTFGPSGKEARRDLRLIDCDTDHLENILITQVQITPLYKRVILAILKRRWTSEDEDGHVPGTFRAFQSTSRR